MTLGTLYLYLGHYGIVVYIFIYMCIRVMQDFQYHAPTIGAHGTQELGQFRLLGLGVVGVYGTGFKFQCARLRD